MARDSAEGRTVHSLSRKLRAIPIRQGRHSQQREWKSSAAQAPLQIGALGTFPRPVLASTEHSHMQITRTGRGTMWPKPHIATGAPKSSMHPLAGVAQTTPNPALSREERTEKCHTNITKTLNTCRTATEAPHAQSVCLLSIEEISIILC